jgi:hypothetical protein
MSPNKPRGVPQADDRRMAAASCIAHRARM